MIDLNRRDVVHTGLAALMGVAAASCGRTAPGSPAALPDLPQSYRDLAALDAPSGRVVVSDSLSYLSLREDVRIAGTDVIVGCSFAGLVTFAPMLALGARAIIAHAAGVGLDNAGIAGLDLAERYGVPAAACETMSARLSDGRSLYQEGIVSHANAAASGHGVVAGMPVKEAAARLLAAPRGAPRPDIPGANNYTVGDVTPLVRRGSGGVFAAWYINLVEGLRPDDVFVTASHCGKSWADYTLKVRPKGIIANDAAFCKDRSAVAGLATLDDSGTPAASVAAASARIGDAMSTWRTGLISEINASATGLGVRRGMSARDAALLMLQRG